jgi:transcriptional regulator with XRE-family HTH domain
VRLAERLYGVPSALVLFGKQVRRLRIERRLSQEKLAEMCDFHRNQIGRIERAEQTVSFDGLLQLSHGLAVPPSEIFQLKTACTPSVKPQ